jgi:MSHA pilin protein MshC
MKNQYKGFTLIEVVITLVLVSILSAFALPRMGGESVFDERGYQDAVRSSLQYASRVAVASRRYVCVSIISNTKLVFTRDINSPENVIVVQCNTNLNIPGSESSCAQNEVCPRSGKSMALTGNNLIFDPAGRPVDINKSPLNVNTIITVAGRTITVYAETGVIE